MASTSSEELAREILACCLAGASPPESKLECLLERADGPDREVAAAASKALFRGVAEPLSDRFDPALCDAYVSLFARVIAFVRQDIEPGALVARYQRIRGARHYTDFPLRPSRICVLSRVTLALNPLNSPKFGARQPYLTELT